MIVTHNNALLHPKGVIKIPNRPRTKEARLAARRAQYDTLPSDKKQGTKRPGSRKK